MKTRRTGTTGTESWFPSHSGDTRRPAFDAWPRDRADPSMLVAILDRSVQLDHPDLALRIWQSPFDTLNDRGDDGNSYVDDLWGWDSADWHNDLTDMLWHGFDVSGIIAAVWYNNQGIDAAAEDVRGRCLGSKFRCDR